MRKKKSMNTKLICNECNLSEDIPKHCGKPMHIEEINGKKMLVCWMGPSCGVKELPTHHNQPMKIV